MDPRERREAVFSIALDLGFCAAGVTGVEPFAEAGQRGVDAMRAGRMDGMPWLSELRFERSSNPAWRFPWAQSMLALAWPYAPALTPGSGIAPLPIAGQPRGRIAAYACMKTGDQAADYHALLSERCDAVVTRVQAEIDPSIKAKRFIDHGWAIDRAIAERAGLGFCGKHASVLTTAAGSYVMLAALLLSTELAIDEPSKRACGSCHACLPACPTGAIVAPGVIDARRCISYLTIEHEGPIDTELRPLIGTWVFGCDLCQEACPVNTRRAPTALVPGVATLAGGPVPFPDLIELLNLDEAQFAARFANSAVLRSGRARLARNAAMALGNAGDPMALDALRYAAEADPDDAVRDAAQWAMTRLELVTSRER